jgi:methionyl-tRNA synthetase
MFTNSVKSNAFFQDSSPWNKILDFGPGEPGEDVDKIVYLAAEALRITGILLLPYMPNKASTLLDQLGVQHDRRTFEWCKPDADLDYGTPLVELGVQHKGVLFPPLPNGE